MATGVLAFCSNAKCRSSGQRLQLQCGLHSLSRPFESFWYTYLFVIALYKLEVWPIYSNWTLQQASQAHVQSFMSLRSPCAKKHLLVLRFRVFPPSGSSQQQWPAFDFCHLERGWNSNAAEQEPTTQFFQLYSWSILYIYICIYICSSGWES